MKDNEAAKVMEKLLTYFMPERSPEQAFIANDNYVLHDLLNDEATSVRDIMDQETWIMGDGSYITRLDDNYWVGEDIDLFDIESELN